MPPEAASTIAGMSSVPPAKIVGVTPVGSCPCTRLTEVVSWLTAALMSVPKVKATTMLAEPSRVVEVTLSTPSVPLTASSIGFVI